MHVPLTEVILTHDGAEFVRATLPPGEYVIGREAGVDLHANTPLLSRKHARLTFNYDHLLIEDLGSSNGTFVNDQPITEATRLFPNQSIRLGPDISLEVRRQRAPTEPGVSLAPAQAAIARHLPAELLAEKRYAIGGIVAQGGMGAILDARQNANKRTVAMKVMLETSDEADVLRFIEEAQITSQLEHPNIVPIYELGVDEQGQVFYTMKMVRGITLKRVLELLAKGVPETVKKYPLPALLTVFQKVCDALAFAHAKGVLHRDLKPENIMLGDFGSVLLMDWGLAKIIGQTGAPGRDITDGGVSSARAVEGDASFTMAGSIMGTPAYMSPEQARGEIETLDARSDIYALGAILFEIVHLRPAITGTDAMEIVGKVARGAEKQAADALVAAEKQAAKVKAQADRERLPSLIQTHTTKAADGTLELDLRGQNLHDLTALKDVKIFNLIVQENPISDLSPLAGMPLRVLHLARTNVGDLSPLRGMPLEKLDFDQTPVKDLRPLLEMPKLRNVMIPRAAANIEVLRPLKNLEYIGWDNDWQDAADIDRPLTAEQFWKRFDALKAAGKN